jgi:hypothetical protein
MLWTPENGTPTARQEEGLMPMQARLLQRAIALSEAGSREDARRLLQAVLQENPDNQCAWFHYVETLPTPEERMVALRRLLHHDPANRRAQRRLWELWEQKYEAKARADRRRRPSHVRPSHAWWLLLALTVVGLLSGLLYVRQEILARYLALSSEHSTLQVAHDRLATEREELLVAHRRLQMGHDELRGEREALKAANEQLVGERNHLQAQYDELFLLYDGQVMEYNRLLSDHGQLQREYDNLLARYEWLEQEGIRPPYIYVKERTVHIAFEKLDSTVDRWEVSFENLESSILQGAWQRDHPDWFEIYDEDTGRTFTKMNYRPYVQPGPFELVMGRLYDESASDDAFIRETWNIVRQLTTYAPEDVETPRFPSETFLAGGGDCEDTSILFASMIKAAPVDWTVELVYLDGDHPHAPETLNHVMVCVDTGEHTYWVETTSKGDMEPFGPVAGWVVEV